MPKTSKSYHSDPRRPHDKPPRKAEEEEPKEEPKEDYPSARKRAVREAVKETKRTESGALRMPEMTITGDPRAAEEREERSARSAELEAVEAALEDQQSRRLQKSISSEMWEDATDVAEAFGIPIGLLTAGYGLTKAGIADLIGTKEVVSAADPVTAAYKPPRVGDVHLAGHEKADLPSGIKPGGMEGAGTLKGQAKAEATRLSKEAHKIVGGVDPRSADWKKRVAFEQAVGAGTSAEEALKQADVSWDTRGRPKHGVDRTGKGDWQFDPITDQEYDWGYDPKDTLHRSQETVAKDIQRGTAPSSVLEQKKYLQGKPAYGVSLPKGQYPAAFQTYKNLTAQAKELLKPVSKTIGYVSPWLAAAAAVTGAWGASSLILDELDEADSEAIPTTMRILARLNESPLKAGDVAPEALEKLIPEEVEELHRDGTISYQLYEQLR